MRLLAASLVVGGCVLTAGAASASELRLDDTALDQVTAGLESADFADVTAQQLGDIDERRNFLLGLAALVAAENLAASYNKKTGDEIADDPSFGPVDAGLRSLAASLLPPLDDGNGGNAGGTGTGNFNFPSFPGFPPF